MKATRGISILVHWASARVAKLAMRNAQERAPWRGKFDPIEGVIIHEEVAEPPRRAAVREQQRLGRLQARLTSMRPSLGRRNKLAAHGRLSSVGPEGIARYP